VIKEITARRRNPPAGRIRFCALACATTGRVMPHGRVPVQNVGFRPWQRPKFLPPPVANASALRTRIPDPKTRFPVHQRLLNER
jgi:hypothetical protein